MAIKLHTFLRWLTAVNHVLALGSAAIVVGLISWSLARDNNTVTHILYQEVIAVMTLLFYLIGVLFPLLEIYRGYLMPFNVIWSYLWIISITFSVQDWGGNKCVDEEYGRSRCSIRKAIIAFNFLTFFALVSYAITEFLHWRAHMTHKKERSASDASHGNINRNETDMSEAAV